jgi:hypothetical protein
MYFVSQLSCNFVHNSYHVRICDQKPLKLCSSYTCIFIFGHTYFFIMHFSFILLFSYFLALHVLSYPTRCKCMAFLFDVIVAPALKPNSWTYNFVEFSGHNLESSQTWDFCMDFLNHREGVWFSIRFSSFL